MIGTHVNTCKTDFRAIYYRDEKSWMPDILIQLTDASGSYAAHHLYPLNQMSTCTSYMDNWTVVEYCDLHSWEKAGLRVTVGGFSYIQHHAFT